MYCTACGKQIIDTARFCNYCGNPVAGTVIPEPNYQSTPVKTLPNITESTSENIADNMTDSNIGNDIGNFRAEPAENGALTGNYDGIGNEEIISENSNFFGEDPSGSPDGQTAAYEPAPEPVSEPEIVNGLVASDKIEPVNAQMAEYANAQTADQYSLPAPGVISASGESGIQTADIPEKPVKPAKPLPERKYTLGHIMMCLCAVAVMAIIAGVFAGLYFSVI